jgi:hypothetical protein
MDFITIPRQHGDCTTAVIGHLSQRPFWSFRGFRHGVACAMEPYGFTQVQPEKEIGISNAMISRTIGMTRVSDEAETLERAFYGNIVMPDGRTIYESTAALVEAAYKGGQVQALLPDYSGRK